MRSEDLRICMISASFLPTIGGLQFQTKYLVDGLSEKGVNVFFLSYEGSEKILKKRKNGFPKFIKLKHRSLLLGCVELYKLLKRFSPHIIHVHLVDLKAFQIALLKLIGLLKQPFIITSHGIDIMTYREVGYGFRLNPLNALVIRFTLHQCNKHVIVSKNMKRFALEAGSRKDQIIEISNGIPLLKENEISGEKTMRILSTYGIFSVEPVLLSLSGMRPLKGIEYLVMAMPKILKHFPDTKLLLACNGGKYKGYIRNLVKSLGIEKNVKFIGFIKDEEVKRILIRRCDVFCKPSLLEACSVAILEAMREGKVVVASVPGGIDIITHNRNGILTRPKDPKSFARGVLKVLRSKHFRKKIEDHSREDVKIFSIEKIAEKYISLYKRQ